MEKVMDLSGIWQAQAEDAGDFQVKLPGTLDTNKIGHEDEKDLTTRLTRLYTYEGTVRYFKSLTLPEVKNEKLFIRIERSRELSLKIEDHIIKPFLHGSLSTPWLFDVTRYASKKVMISIIVDNYFTSWPRSSIINSSAATDETQTNWNGIIGDFAIYKLPERWIESIRVYPTLETVDIRGTICGLDKHDIKEGNFLVYIEGMCLEESPVSFPLELYTPDEDKMDSHLDLHGKSLSILITNIRLSPNILRWDEGEGNLNTINVSLIKVNVTENLILDQKSTAFGVRTFGVDEGLRLTLNGRRFFLRGEANCCVFPETGHPPMDEAGWEKVLSVFATYGVNCMRFHSWCPPEAAFDAADKLGMMMQPELSQWNFKDAFGDEKARKYYKRELFAILKMLANHPSFVMLTFGNELQYTRDGYEFAKHLLDEARTYDPTRLYANASNYHYGEEGVDPGSDFYTAMGYHKDMLRATSSPMTGHLNDEYPSSCHTYDVAVSKVHGDHKSVFGFEVGQYEILPDFSEISMFRGVTRAKNLEILKKRVEDLGLSRVWENFVASSGELARICYKEEIEAVLRTQGMSGVSLLGLQDFPGQGTAIVGMLNSHLVAKPFGFAKSGNFNSFFGPIVPLLYLKKYTYFGGEILQTEFKLAHYGKKSFSCEAKWMLKAGEKIVSSGSKGKQNYIPGRLIDIGKLEIELPKVDKACRMNLYIDVGQYENTYPVWVYSNEEYICPKDVIIADSLDEGLLETITSGKTCFLEPKPTAENFPHSIQGTFTTNFWSVGTFPDQPGGMGLLIDENHPALKEFPTEFYSNYQWWIMAHGRPMILPRHIKPVITVPDCFSRLRHMGLLFEATFGKGHIMVSSMGLLDKQDYPECRGLLKSLLHYLGNRGKISVSQETNRQCIQKEELLEIIKVRA